MPDRRDARVAVAAAADDPSLRAAAVRLAGELSLPLADDENGTRDGPDLRLVVGRDRLELRPIHRAEGGPVFVDFVGGPVGYRRRSGRGRNQPIARAVGLRAGVATVVDATAGLARDSFLLACLGCTVTAVERSPVLAALVQDGLIRARRHGPAELIAVLDRLTLVVDDAGDVLNAMAGSGAPDVVYLDPMYAPARKTALARKEMRICRQLVGDDLDADALFAVAREVAVRRVVVKRHPHAAPLVPNPTLQHGGRTARYDVYLRTSH